MSWVFIYFSTLLEWKKYQPSTLRRNIFFPLIYSQLSLRPNSQDIFNPTFFSSPSGVYLTMNFWKSNTVTITSEEFMVWSLSNSLILNLKWCKITYLLRPGLVLQSSWKRQIYSFFNALKSATDTISMKDFHQHYGEIR